jgi:hypothetical protein
LALQHAHCYSATFGKILVAPGGGKVDLVTHQGEAVGYLVSGTIELTIDDTTYLMTPIPSSSRPI